MSINYTFVAVNTITGVQLNIGISSALQIAGPTLPPLLFFPGTFVDPLFLTINALDIIYTPINLTDVSVEISVPALGMTITDSSPIPISESNLLPNNITGIVLQFPGPSRVISNTFAQTGLSSTTTTASAVISTGDTSIPIGPVPSDVPVDIEIAPFCIHPDSQVHTNRGLKRLGDIKTKDKLLVYDHEWNLIEIKHNIEFIGSEKFVKFAVCSLGINQPNYPLYVTEGHPVLFKGKEFVAKDLINGKNITLETNHVSKTYCLATEKRTFVMINGMKVCTWCMSDLKAIAKEKGLYYRIV
jgi:hypothetical protein